MIHDTDPRDSVRAKIGLAWDEKTFEASMGEIGININAAPWIGVLNGLRAAYGKGAKDAGA